MRFSLIICTYMRPKSLLRLLKSVNQQTLYPDEIIIVDGSTDEKTSHIFENTTFKNLFYYKVNKTNRGLTKQRNWGISKVSKLSEVVSFLDDDTVLTENYFKVLIDTFKSNDKIAGVGGLAINENRWEQIDLSKEYNKYEYYKFENFVLKESSRNVIRKKLGLISPYYYGIMPEFSHGRGSGFPFNDKVYKVDLLIGMSFSFRKRVTDRIKFSTYFEGYGLYEDADYSIRAQELGINVINTNLQLYHYHEASGRPNKYEYGKMVVKNGWYVWRRKHKNPSFKNITKWYLITILLMTIRFVNIFTTKKRKEAFTESLGRFIGLINVLIKR